MKNFATALLVAGITTLFASCEKIEGDGPIVTETRSNKDFGGIDLRMSGNVYFTQAPEYKVEVRAQQNILNVLQTYVANNKLVIKFENDVRVRSHESITINISAPDLSSLRVSGSGDIQTVGILQPNNMDITVSGSGSISVQELQTGDLDATISGSGDIKVLSGSADHEDLKISGSGDMDLEDVVAQTAATTTSGSGNMRVHVTEDLRATISGSGSVLYKGQPKVNTTISGSGKVRAL